MIPFRLHYRGSRDLPDIALESALIQAFRTWAVVDTADLHFFQGTTWVGDACPDGDWENHGSTCPTRAADVDYEPVLLFMEEEWPFGHEVIALTVVSWAEGGVLVDADTAFNAADYDFTWGDEAVEIDVLSIATHEMGHFIGLGHSTELDATMAPSYDPGELDQRDLNSDDREGVSWVYPCANVPCGGGVAWEEGCSMVGRHGGMVVALGLAAWLGRRRPRIVSSILLLLTVAPARSSFVASLTSSELGELADLVVRATVEEVTPYDGGIVRTRVRLRVTEDWKGLPPREIELDQPGGRLPGRGTLAFGMPEFRAGEDVVLYLDWPEGGAPRVLGLQQGKWSVGPDGTLLRRLDVLSLVRPSATLVREPSPTTLGALRSSLRR